MTSMRQEPLVMSADEALLLDSYRGEYDVAEVHACIVNGDVKTSWEAIRNADLSSIPVVVRVSGISMSAQRNQEVDPCGQ
jgi:hypothetical protein